MSQGTDSFDQHPSHVWQCHDQVKEIAGLVHVFHEPEDGVQLEVLCPPDRSLDQPLLFINHKSLNECYQMFIYALITMLNVPY